MGLEKQFDDLIPIEFGGEMQEPLRTGCIVIAENFAIGFTEWLISSSILKTEIPMNVKLKMYKNQKTL